MLYIQALNSVVIKDELPVSELIALQLAGLQAQINLGDFKSDSKPKDYNDVMNYICKRILMKKQSNGQPKPDWPSRIRDAHCQHSRNMNLNNSNKNSNLVPKAWYLSVVMQYPLVIILN